MELWETRPKPREFIGIETVEKAITTERLADDMELELRELFPRHGDLRLEAVRLEKARRGPQTGREGQAKANAFREEGV